MIIDCSKWHLLPDGGQSERRLVFVDGVEIKRVRYVDTYEGYVETMDLGDGAGAHTGRGFDRSKFPKEWEIDAPEDGAVVRTIRGHVELRPI